MTKNLNEITIIQYAKFIRISTIVGFIFVISGLFCKNCFVLKGVKLTEPASLFVLFTQPENVFHILVQSGILIILANPVIGLGYLAIKSMLQKAYVYAVLCVSIILFLLIVIFLYIIWE